jgi:hypothetical protein
VVRIRKTNGPRWLRGCWLVLTTALFVACFSAGDNDSSSSAFGRACESDSECEAHSLVCDEVRGCVQCRVDGECSGDQLCLAGKCEDRGSGGSAGTGGGSEAGATSSAGGTPGGAGDSGDAGNGGAGPGSAEAGAGGAGEGCRCSDGLACDADGACVDPDLLDDLADCDVNIIEVAGRSGEWYADADTGINQAFAVSSPGSSWGDQSCAAWSTGGPLEVGTQTWAVMGFQIAGGAAYDLSGYFGVDVTFESGEDVVVVVKTAGGGYFAATAAATGSASAARQVPFAGMAATASSSEAILELSQVTELQFSPVNPAAFGYAVHRVALF